MDSFSRKVRQVSLLFEKECQNIEHCGMLSSTTKAKRMLMHSMITVSIQQYKTYKFSIKYSGNLKGIVLAISISLIVCIS